jgi:hypothetical protein
MCQPQSSSAASIDVKRFVAITNFVVHSLAFSFPAHRPFRAGCNCLDRICRSCRSFVVALINHKCGCVQDAVVEGKIKGKSGVAAKWIDSATFEPHLVANQLGNHWFSESRKKIVLGFGHHRWKRWLEAALCSVRCQYLLERPTGA